MISLSIPLTQGKFAFVDEDDHKWLSQWNWSLDGRGYASRTVLSNEKRDGVKVKMHRAILERHGADLSGFQVDHINHNSLDNRKINLRAATSTQNQRNHKKHQPATGKYTSKYKGVCTTTEGGNWRACIWINGKSKQIGAYATEAAAALAYNQESLKCHGEFACINEVPEREIPDCLEAIKKKFTSKHKGVSWHKKNSKWVAYITISGKRKYLGSYQAEVEAAAAYNKAALEYLGNNAQLNDIAARSGEFVS